MTFRVAREIELDAYFALSQFNDIVLGMEIDQAGRSAPQCSFSLLTSVAYSFITLIGSRTI
jgi:hypothetical protein